MAKDLPLACQDRVSQPPINRHYSLGKQWLITAGRGSSEKERVLQREGGHGLIE